MPLLSVGRSLAKDRSGLTGLQELDRDLPALSSGAPFIDDHHLFRSENFRVTAVLDSQSGPFIDTDAESFLAGEKQTQKAILAPSFDEVLVTIDRLAAPVQGGWERMRDR